MRNVDINRERVLGLIKTANIPLTTKEMGRILKVKERSVRAAVGWLKMGGFIVFDGEITRQTTPTKYGKRKFKVKVYTWTGKEDKICKLHTKDMPDGALQVKNYGDPVMLQNIMMRMGK